MVSAASWILRKLLWLLALVFFATCVTLIYESAQSGISPLFSWATPSGAEQSPALPVSVSGAFEVVTLTHIVLGTTASWALVWACLKHGARKAIGIARGLTPVAVALMVFAALAPLMHSQLVLGFGWPATLWPDQPPPEPAATILRQATDPLVQWPLLLVFCYIASATLLAVTKPERRIAVIITLIAVATLALLIAGWVTAGVPFNQLTRTAPLGLALLAFVSFVQTDGDRPGHAHIWTGTAMTIAAGIYGTAQATAGLTNPYATVLMTMLAYTGPYAMATFLGFAYLDIRWQPRLPRLLVWGHALGLAVIAAFAFLPFAAAEMRSLPMRQIDYPADYAPARFMLANAQALLLVWMLAGLALMRRYRLAPAPHLPLLQDQSTKHASPQAA